MKKYEQMTLLKRPLKSLLIVVLSISWVGLGIAILETDSLAGKDHQRHPIPSSDMGFGNLITTTNSFSPSIFKRPIKSLEFERMVSLETGLDKGLNIASGSYPYYSYGSSDFFFPPYLSDGDRMGYNVVLPLDGTILNAGWYMDWGAASNPDHPNGAEYVRHIIFRSVNPDRLCGYVPAPATNPSHITASLAGTALIQAVQANPSALWLIGNEPDAIFNGGSMQAEFYAQLYHDYYTTIKAADPTAKVAIGAVSQPSPLRMEYLDRILNHYQALYGHPLPTDLWNIHFYILREVQCDWGVSLPPFVGGPGWEISLTPGAMLNLATMENNLRTFRRWMYDRGYRDTPLIITEYGVLPRPEFAGFPDSVAAQFLKDTSNLFLTATNPTTGYPADNYRLVQAWGWFSTRFEGFGGDLFDANGNLTIIGHAFRDQTVTHYNPYVDLQPIPPVTLVPSSNAFNVTAYVKNRGNTKATDVKVDLSLVEAASGAIVAKKVLDLGEIQRRYAESPKLIEHTWHIGFSQAPTIMVPYTLNISVTTPDANLANNHLSYSVNWFPLVDLAVTDLTLSSPPIFKFEEPTTLVATATIANAGVHPTPETVSKFALETPDAQTIDLTSLMVVPPLQPSDTWTFTTTVPITQAGYFKLSASLPVAVGPAELLGNNDKVVPIMAAKYMTYLPIIFR